MAKKIVVLLLVFSLLFQQSISAPHHQSVFLQTTADSFMDAIEALIKKLPTLVEKDFRDISEGIFVGFEKKSNPDADICINDTKGVEDKIFAIVNIIFSKSTKSPTTATSPATKKEKTGSKFALDYEAQSETIPFLHCNFPSVIFATSRLFVSLAGAVASGPQGIISFLGTEALFIFLHSPSIVSDLIAIPIHLSQNDFFAFGKDIGDLIAIFLDLQECGK
ncbi:hypothetical protein CYY_002896 [Polysphondylium violaceum]|uniref:Uncharacterized protein n=1 Tax=Polysphondylium violaceum TaxID=133409 RepID=A0A8J4PVM0_9MYCE|nr:hypothetical protein CYY_002896 [Polysphondylium violaceum]